jgi:MATE family multidrug resistance protein
VQSNVKTQSIHAALWTLALPVMLSNISIPLLGLVDTAILGHLSDSRYLAAVAMGSSLLVMVMWSFSFLRMGTTALIARHYNQAIEVSGILQSALLFALVIGTGLIIVAPWLIEFMVGLIGAAADITPLTTEYLKIRFYFAPVTLINYVVIGYFIGKGLTRINLILLVSTNILNASLNYLFVYKLNWLSAGVAWGSNFAELFQLVLGLFFIQNTIKKSVVQSTAWPSMRQRFKQFMNLNLQLFIRTFLLLFAFAFFMAQGAQHSTALLSANAILINLLMLMSNALDGFAVASESMVGQSLADKKYTRLKPIIKVSGIWSLITASLFTLLLAISYDHIFALLTSQQDVITLLNTLSLWLIFLPLAGFASFWLDGIYIGLACASQMKNSIIFSLTIIFLPLIYLFSFWEYHGLWLAMYGFLLARAIWLLCQLPSQVIKYAN